MTIPVERTAKAPDQSDRAAVCNSLRWACQPDDVGLIPITASITADPAYTRTAPLCAGTHTAAINQTHDSVDALPPCPGPTDPRSISGARSPTMWNPKLTATLDTPLRRGAVYKRAIELSGHLCP